MPNPLLEIKVISGDAVAEVLQTISVHCYASLDTGPKSPPVQVVSMEVHLAAMAIKDQQIKKLMQKLHPPKVPTPPKAAIPKKGKGK